MLIEIVAGPRTGAQLPRAVDLTHKPTMLVPVSLLAAPEPESALFACAVSASAWTIVVAPTLRFRFVTVDEQLALTCGPFVWPEQVTLAVSLVIRTAPAPPLTLSATPAVPPAGRSTRLTVVLIPKTLPSKVNPWPAIWPTSALDWPAFAKKDAIATRTPIAIAAATRDGGRNPAFENSLPLRSYSTTVDSSSASLIGRCFVV